MRIEISAKSETEGDKLLGIHTDTIEEELIETAHLEQSIIDDTFLEEEETISISENTDNIFIKTEEKEYENENLSETSIDNKIDDTIDASCFVEIKYDDCKSVKEEAEGDENYIKEETQEININIKEEPEGDENNTSQGKGQSRLSENKCNV